MDDLSFLVDARKGDFSVIVNTVEGRVVYVDGLNVDILRARCPALVAAAAVRGDEAKYTFENKSAEAVISLLRHIYLEDYTYCEAGLERPCSLLFHLQVFQLARMFDMTGLQDTVRFYILQETERFHETRFPVHDFYEGIMYLYTDLRQCKDIRDIISNYCVNRFAHFQFAEKEMFRQTAFESPLFHKDLQQANIKNEFDNPAAMEIVQLPVCTHRIHAMDVDFACQHHSPVTTNDGLATPIPDKTSTQIPNHSVNMPPRPLKSDYMTPPSYPQTKTFVIRPATTRPSRNSTTIPPLALEPSQSKYWRDLQSATRQRPTECENFLDRGNARVRQHLDPRQTPDSNTLVNRLWDVLGDDHEGSVTTVSTDDEWTMIDSTPQATNEGQRKNKRKWIVGADDEGSDRASRSYDSEWSLVSSP